MRREILREVLGMVLVELCSPVRLVDSVRDPDVILVVLVKRAVRIERHHRVRTHATHVVDEAFAQRDFARVGEPVGLPTEFDDLGDAESFRRAALLRVFVAIVSAMLSPTES